MKKIISVLLTLLMLSSMLTVFSVSNSAASTKYIGALQLGAYLNKISAEFFAGYNLENNKIINFNLNSGNDTTQIYLAYQKTNNEDEAIRDIICLVGDIYEYCSSWTNESNGCTYYPVKGYNEFSPVNFVDEYHTININQDTDGKDLYLFYTCDPKAGDPLTTIWIDGLNDKYEAVKFTDGQKANLNEGNNGDQIYLKFKRTRLSTSGSIFTENTTWVYITAGVIIIVGIFTGIFFTKKRKTTATV